MESAFCFGDLERILFSFFVFHFWGKTQARDGRDGDAGMEVDDQVPPPPHSGSLPGAGDAAGAAHRPAEEEDPLQLNLLGGGAAVSLSTPRSANC